MKHMPASGLRCDPDKVNDREVAKLEEHEELQKPVTSSSSANLSPKLSAKRQRLVQASHTEPARDRFEEHPYYNLLQQSVSKKLSLRLNTSKALDKAAKSFPSLNCKGAESQPGEDAEIDQAHVFRTV